MEIKKSPKASLENKKLLFNEIGLVVALLVVLGAFEWSTKEKEVSSLEATNTVAVEDEVIPITQDTPPPPPEAPKEPVLSDVIDIVDDNIKVDESLLLTTEDDNSLGVEIKEYIPSGGGEEEVVEEEEIPIAIVEEKPKFQGKDANEFTKWVATQIVYPQVAAENGVQGKVFVAFTIGTDGSVSNVQVLRGVDSSLDKEAVRVVSSSPKWTPGKQRNKPVKVKYSFPVNFQLH